MRTIQIKKNVREDLKHYSYNGESVDEAINRLLDSVEDEMDKDFKFGVGTTNINLNEETMDRIKSFKLNPRESYGRIIARALKIVNEEEK